MDQPTSYGARLSLRGHEPAGATIQLVWRSRRTRTTSALLALLGFWALAPLVFLIPPHLPWGLAAALAGLYFAFRQWNGEYVVEHFQGSCPRCASPLHIAPGTRIRLPHKMVCYQCHHEPVLEIPRSR